MKCGYGVKVDSRSPITRLAGLIELLPNGLYLWWRVVGNIGTLPREDFNEKRTPFVVRTLKHDMRMVEDESKSNVNRPAFPAEFSVFRFVPRLHMRDAMNCFSSGARKLGGSVNCERGKERQQPFSIHARILELARPACLLNLAKFARRHAVVTPEQAAERSEAFKSGAEADFRDAQLRLPQKFRGPSQPMAGQIVVRRFAEGARETAVEMRG
jgi:hypothetical protein